MSPPAPEPRPRQSSADMRLARLGFQDPPTALRLVELPGWDISADPELMAALGDAADPDQALACLARLAEAEAKALGSPDGLRAALRRSPGFRRRLVAVLGASSALGDHLARHPEDWRLLDREPGPPRTAETLRAGMLTAVGADPYAELTGGRGPVADAASGAAALLDDLRVEYRRWLLTLAARDLTGIDTFEDVAAELADLAAATLEAALSIARANLPAGAEPCRLAVIGMGKCGGRELNYVSDVDVIFVAEPLEGGDETKAMRTATQLASGMMQACSAATAEGTVWPVDAALRPEGKAGPLVRTLASHVAYYERWAKTWEFQALLKARPVAGDPELGARYVDAVTPLVWKAANRDNFVADVQAMRRRVEDNIPAGQADRQIKLGPGGLRDVEFAVQLLQLVHGRGDPSLHSGTTLSALMALARGGYVGREDATRLGDAYRFLRTLEHRIQLHKMWRTHVLPEGQADLRRLGRSMGMRTDPVTELTETWRRHVVEVRRLHEKLFYRPLLAAVARLPEDTARLTPAAARTRLAALGYADPAGALRHLEALTSGLSRRAAIQRTLLPVMLGWFADAADPDAGLLAFRQVSDELGSTPWYLRLLRDEGMAAERMAYVLASSRFATALLMRAPETVAMLADDAELRPRTRAALEAEVSAAVARASSAEAAAVAARAVRRREMFRTAAADALGMLDVDEVGPALSAAAGAAVAGVLTAATRAVEAGRPPVIRMAVIALGRLGGREMGYSSDADVLFVHEPLPGVEEKVATDTAQAIANELRRLMSMQQCPEPALEVDAHLRPEGRNGPLVRSLASYEAYYSRWSSVWESQALLRAEPLAGDAGLGARFMALVEPLRRPPGGLTDDQVREIRRIKARVESERLPRGADPATHTKLGRGGLADVEWVAQLLQLQHGARVPGLATTGTLDALAAAAGAGVLAQADAEVLAEAWRMATRVRNAIMLVRGRPGDTPPSGGRELTSIARCLGYPPEETGRMLEDYRRVTRRARAVVERVFYQ